MSVKGRGRQEKFPQLAYQQADPGVLGAIATGFIQQIRRLGYHRGVGKMDKGKRCNIYVWGTVARAR